MLGPFGRKMEFFLLPLRVLRTVGFDGNGDKPGVHDDEIWSSSVRDSAIVKRFFRLERNFIIDCTECLRCIVFCLIVVSDWGRSGQDFVSLAESPLVGLEGMLLLFVFAVYCCSCLPVGILSTLSRFVVRPGRISKPL